MCVCVCVRACRVCGRRNSDGCNLRDVATEPSTSFLRQNRPRVVPSAAPRALCLVYFSVETWPRALDLPFFFHSAKTIFVCGDSLKILNSMKRGAIFRHFCVSKVIATAHAHKSGVFFILFLELSNKKKIKELRPNMTKIASRGPALKKKNAFLLQVVLFCDNSSDPSRRHNPEPRTNQNKFCSNRSVWEVLLDDHKDFVNFTAPSKSEPGKSERDLVPNFKVRSVIKSYTCSRMVNSSSR